MFTNIPMRTATSENPQSTWPVEQKPPKVRHRSLQTTWHHIAVMVSCKKKKKKMYLIIHSSNFHYLLLPELKVTGMYDNNNIYFVFSTHKFFQHVVMFLHVFTLSVQVHGSHTCCVGFFCAPSLPMCTHAFSTVWPFRSLPAVLTLVCVDSKHSCRSQRPRSGRTRGSEGQWWREGRRGRAGREEMEGGIRRGENGSFLFQDSSQRLCFVLRTLHLY